MFGIETASRAQLVVTHFCLRAFRLKPNPGLLPCLVSQLAPLAELELEAAIVVVNLGRMYYVCNDLLITNIQAKFHVITKHLMEGDA